MSVMIRGMKMPNGCKECKLCYRVEDNIDSPMQCILSPYYRWCCIDDVPDDYREDDCPLVELPENHGRLGDLDVLRRELIAGHDLVGAKYVEIADTVIEAEGEE